jgi:apolipoprotein N-acyltransferase
VIVNLTNDGWFGNTTGPRQHLHQARVRAVEEGLPLIRAANNGVSAAFDAYGRPLGQLDLNVRGVIDVPLAAAAPPPPYAHLGDAVFLTAWLSGIVLLSCVVWRQ